MHVNKPQFSMNYLLLFSLIATPVLAQSTAPATPAPATETRSLSRTVITTTNSPAAYTDRSAILNLLKDRVKATNDHNTDRIAACFTTDATVIVNGELKRTLTIYLDGLAATGSTNTVISNQQITRLRIENNFAFVTETYDETPVPTDAKTGTNQKADSRGSEPRPAVVLEVLRKGEDGRWRITHFHVSTKG
jgi:uncharacterized protein (TIGR02246 family)